jgi:alcohol dehydrogenase class IV
MYNFNTTPFLAVGENSIKQLDSILGLLEISKPLIITGPNISKTNILIEVKNNIYHCDLVYDKVIAEPPISCIHEAVQLATENNVDGVIALGGGSPLDVAKLVAILADQKDPWFGKRDLNSMFGVGNVVNSGLPVVAIPTTAGSGSEVTPVAIFTTGDKEKMGVVSPKIIPKAAILEPKFTVSCSPQLTAYSAIDAMIHAIEACTSVNPNNNPYSKMLANEALFYLSKSTKTAILEPENLKARADVQYGAMLAGQAFANSPVAAVHALAYPIGANFGLAHGLTNTLVLPAVLTFNDCEEYFNICDLMCYEDHGELLLSQRPDMILSRWFRNIAELAGIKTRLSDYGITKADCKMMAKQVMNQTRLLVNNPKEITEEIAEQLYLEVL